jgi:hypothetical protein
MTMIRLIRPALACLVILASGYAFGAERGQVGSEPVRDEPIARTPDQTTDSDRAALTVTDRMSETATTVVPETARGAYRPSRDGEGEPK